jgi:septal ring factor EnvC (AmiA/AmiB activator)
MNNENGVSGQNKIVNVRGVAFDISSILNDVTVSIQNNIQRSLDGALKDYELYKSTHDAILQLPFVRDLYIQNQELVSQLEMLEQPNAQSQPIQLKIDELSPQSSPVVMHSYFQTGDNYYENTFTKNTNEKLSDTNDEDRDKESQESEKSDSNSSSSSSEAESESQESASEEESEQEEAEEAVSASESEDQEQAELEDEEEEAQAEEEEAEAEAEAEEEEAEAEEEEEEAEEEEAEEEEAEEEEAEAEEEEEEEEVHEIVIKNVTYFTTNEENGDIYSCVDGDVGEIVGKFKNKKPVFMKRK